MGPKASGRSKRKPRIDNRIRPRRYDDGAALEDEDSIKPPIVCYCTLPGQNYGGHLLASRKEKAIHDDWIEKKEEHLLRRRERHIHEFEIGRPAGSSSWQIDNNDESTTPWPIDCPRKPGLKQQQDGNAKSNQSAEFSKTIQSRKRAVEGLSETQHEDFIGTAENTDTRIRPPKRRNVDKENEKLSANPSSQQPPFAAGRKQQPVEEANLGGYEDTSGDRRLVEMFPRHGMWISSRPCYENNLFFHIHK